MALSEGKIDIKRAVSENRQVRFVHYRHMEGREPELWYVTEFQELFPVPISDIGDATFHAQEKALLMMRYMRKWNAALDD